jgi:hypothetical protein
MKKSIVIVGTVFTFLLGFSFQCWSQGNDLYGCYQKNNGQLRFVSQPSACRSSEIPISWNQIGPQGPAGPAGSDVVAPQTEAAPGPQVYDASGQFLGVLPSDFYGSLSIYIPTLSRFFSISSDDGDVDPLNPAVYLYFDGENCTGNGYVDTSLRYQVMKVGTIYIRADDATADCMAIKSLSGPSWDGGRQCRTYTGSCVHALPYKEVSLPFTMPVALPLNFEY